MKELAIIEQTIENLKVQNDILLRENLKLEDKIKKLEKNIKKLEKNNKKEENYFTKYRTLYMKYKHQQNNFEKITNQYKEVIRLLQAEIIQNASNEELFEKVEKLNKLGV